MIIPMTPDAYAPHKIIYPCLVQPKLDGPLPKDIGHCFYQAGQLFNTDWELVYYDNHYVEEHMTGPLKRVLNDRIILEGIIFPKTVKSFGNVDTEFHIFDVVASRTPFKERFDSLVQVLRDTKDKHRVKTVPTRKIFDEKQADDQFKFWIDEGYHGMIYRLGHCYYSKPTAKNKYNRSRQLLLRKNDNGRTLPIPPADHKEDRG